MITHQKTKIVVTATKLTCVLVIAALAGCAQSPDSIQPAYVSTIPYESWTCQQLGGEHLHLSTALATASVQQESARSGDVAGIILLGLPVSSMSGGNIAPQIALYKGQQEAVRQVLGRKACG
jgi:hypothetical protein